MYLFKHFYIFEESDFIFHFLYQENLNTSNRSIKDFDRETPKYVSFKRKIIADNLLNPKDKEWEMTLPKEQLQKLNAERLKASLNLEESKKRSKWDRKPFDDYQVGDYIWHRPNFGWGDKGEVTKVHNLKNNQKAYDIKVGRQVFTKVNCSNLHQRDNVRKQLEIVTDNAELQILSTKQLLSKFKRLRVEYFGIGIDESYLKDKDYYYFLQVRKELCKRPHVTKKEAKYNRK